MLPAHVKLYPTPRVSDTEGGIVKNVKLKDAVNYLEENEMYPTPRSRDWKDGSKVPPSVGKTRSHTLGTKVAEQRLKMLPTPNASDILKYRLKGNTQASKCLPAMARRGELAMYGTPKAQDMRAALTDRGKKNMGEQVHQENNAKVTGARLSPNFVEFLMGYPPNWTKLEPTD